jgi:hypothetical protein
VEWNVRSRSYLLRRGFRMMGICFGVCLSVCLLVRANVPCSLVIYSWVPPPASQALPPATGTLEGVT